MAIKFEKKGDDTPSEKKEVGGKVYVAEEPSSEPTDPPGELPFGKPAKPEKKGKRR